MRRTVIAVLLVVAVFMPAAGMAAQEAPVVRISWWESLVSWFAEVTGLEKATPIEPESQDQTVQDNDTDQGTIIDPNGRN